MKIVRRNDIETKERGGYFVKELLNYNFGRPVESAAFFETQIIEEGNFTEQWHNEMDEMIYFLTPGYATVNGREYEFEKWDLLMLSRGEKHGFRAKKNDLYLLAIRWPDLPNDKFT